MAKNPPAAEPTFSKKAPMFVAFVDDADSLKTLKKFAAANGLATTHLHKGNVADAVAYLADKASPEILLIDIPSADEASAALDKLADVCDPNTRVLVTSTVDEFSFYRWLMDIGVHQYLLKPFTEEMLKTATAEPPASPPIDSKTEASQGKLIAVLGSRGGVGTTTVALNLAAIMADHHQLKTLVLDMQPQWGTVSLMLDLEPGRGLREALAKPERVDGLFMDRVMLKYNEHLSILSSEEPFDEQVIISPGAAEALLKQTRQKFDIIIADLPRELSDFTQTFLREADHVIVITELSLPGLRDAMRLSDYLTKHLKVKDLHFAANRQGMIPKFEMPVAEFEKSLKATLKVNIPFDLDAYGKMASGELPIDARSPGALAKALFVLAETFHTSLQATEKSESKTPRWLNWLKGKSI